MKSVLILLFLSCSTIVFCQTDYQSIFGDSLKEISWSCSILYLPSVQAESIVIKAKPKSFRATYQTYNIRKWYRRKLTRKLKVSKQEFVNCYERYTVLNERFVDFALSENDKDSLRALINLKNSEGRPYYKLSSKTLEKYLESDTIQLDMSVFEMDSLKYPFYGTVIDGAPFMFDVTTVSSYNDTLSNEYRGNLYGSNRYRESPKFLIHFMIFHETTLYQRLPFKNYFSRTKFLHVILRYIEGKEGLIQFRPFELILEDE